MTQRWKPQLADLIEFLRKLEPELSTAKEVGYSPSVRDDGSEVGKGSGHSDPTGSIGLSEPPTAKDPDPTPQDSLRKATHRLEHSIAEAYKKLRADARAVAYAVHRTDGRHYGPAPDTFAERQKEANKLHAGEIEEARRFQEKRKALERAQKLDMRRRG